MTSRHENIQLVCTACSKPFNVLRELAGHLAICPGCGARIEVPEGPKSVASVTGAETVTLLKDQLHAHRKCPVCEASLQKTDQICVACGYDLSGHRHIHTAVKKPAVRGDLVRRILNAAAIAVLAYAVYRVLLRYL